MKEKLYTIPVSEAMEKNGECSFCALQQKLEQDILDYIMGPSYMEEDVREQTNKLGFCKKHYMQMFQAQNRLGLALMTDTHLKQLNQDLGRLMDQEIQGLDKEVKQGLFKKGKINDEVSSRLHGYVNDVGKSCYACSRMEGRMDSYINTFFHLWKTESEFRDKVKSGKGFCLEHFDMVVTQGKQRLSKNDYQELLKILVPIQKASFKRIEEELDWFIKKFDYRFQKEPWKNSKDALERAILKISGIHVND